MRSAMMRQTVPTPGASARAALGVAAKTSATRMAPPGPEPRSAWRSRPRSVASRRAFGDAAASRAAVPPTADDFVRLATWAKTSAFSILPPAGLTWARSTPCSSAILRARGEALTAAAGAGTAVAPAGCPGVTKPASSEAKISAIVCPTGTSSPARAVTSPRTPEAGASISVVALSVSISTSGSPFRTLSPGDLSQCRTLPVSCASSSAGMMTFVGIRRAPSPFPKASRFPAERLRRLEDHLLRRHREVLEYGRERHRYVHGPDPLDRRVEVIEGPLGDHRRELGGDAVALVALVHHDGARGLLGRIDPRTTAPLDKQALIDSAKKTSRAIDQRLLVQGGGGARVDHLGADADFLEHGGGAEGDLHHAAGGHDGDVLAGPLDVRHTEGDGVVLRRHRPLDPVHHLVLEDDHRAVVADGRLHQPLGLVRAGGQGDLEARDVAHPGLERLRVLGGRAPRRPQRGAKDDGHLDLAAGHVVHLGGLVHHLVHGQRDEVAEHHVDDRPHAGHRRPHTDSGVAGL